MPESLAYNVSRVSMRTMSVILAVIVFPLEPGLPWAEESSEHAEWRKRVVLSAEQEIQGDYFAFGPHVEISGTVHGDVYAAGGEVLVDGVVDGDFVCGNGAGCSNRAHAGRDVYRHSISGTGVRHAVARATTPEIHLGLLFSRMAFVVGLGVYFVLSLVPVVGGLVTILTMVIGLGAILMTKKELVARLREQQMV